MTPAQREQRRQAGRARWARVSPEERRAYASKIGKRGGRPTHEETLAKARRREEEARTRARNRQRGRR